MMLYSRFFLLLVLKKELTSVKTPVLLELNCMSNKSQSAVTHRNSHRDHASISVLKVLLYKTASELSIACTSRWNAIFSQSKLSSLELIGYIACLPFFRTLIDGCDYFT